MFLSERPIVFRRSIARKMGLAETLICEIVSIQAGIKTAAGLEAAVGFIPGWEEAAARLWRLGILRIMDETGAYGIDLLIFNLAVEHSDAT
jgi:hypothetical protein